MTAFYNEHDPYAAQYLRNLMAAGLIAPGVVDERDIQEIEPWELTVFTQVHMFAGIGIWSGALRAAGWPDDEPIWTGSCPCQPFSNAGQKKGFSDDRHLWPFWRNLIAECRPPRIAGEQVASSDGKIWLDIVSAEMEALGFAFGAADLCAAGFGGAHIRQRNYFVGLGDAGRGGDEPCRYEMGSSPGNLQGEAREQRFWADNRDGRPISGMADRDQQGGGGRRIQGSRQSNDAGIWPARERSPGFCETPSMGGSLRNQGEIDRRWLVADWLLCRNPSGKPSWRPVESGTFPLAHEIADRVDKLRTYGNALDFETAKGFCEVLVEICLGL